MNAAIQCITLLACVAICSTSALKYCRCVNTLKRVNPSLIAGVKEHGPRPYCRKQEVIVTLKTGKSLCLDPEEEFTKRLLQRTQILRMTRADKNTMSPKSTTESATVSDTASSTASATESATASFTQSAVVLPTSS
ncbi:C-X-C motif chemokine 2-like isoform X1 [Amphiprion ocellaris]|uniref:C-X-C motif chemokine 2-like isoform X1 n=1 Tax=Amphiprion ocellaris TaxID=80972 RepID=UPI002410FDF1|nr:C-X-C motif chemokine 2-like isoform X1 [Amphiprion ocellaris]